ncbi:uncharacterized protein LOC107827871 [Nicotiana tabacum]|uniref:Uncharacterized protein isoform X1 n=1 Tax=Nicotiana tabacum TaxID=4097 RepID=A0A1S4DB37_TOBAC|nr:PREDICTED: uncharacterized protein LOC107827871 isoform X1 [Nicotiana tabacum]XP_016510573.1 PREDICTED: uncharacterized protein LOC107827871 isoform X2 [Nicotiana tabacum]
MASTPRTRPPRSPSSLSPNPKPTKYKTPSSSRPSASSIDIPLEPSSNFFPSSKSEFSRLLAVVFVASAVAFACNYVFTFLNHQPKPFCDSNPDFDESLSDLCEPCPLNGVCHEGKLECAHGYRRLGNLCVEDSNINEAAKKLSKSVEGLLCEEYAQFSCTGAGNIWVQSNQLWEKVNKSKIMDEYGLNKAVYAHAMQRAMEDLGKVLERRLNDQGMEELKCPALLVQHYTPVSCRIQQWLFEHALLLVPACALLLGSIFMLLKLRWRYYLSVRAEQIYNEACDVLEEKAVSARSMTGKYEPWVVASLLRDHLLSPKERKDPMLWKKVEQLVQEDSRLERYPKMVKGESKVVWEWQVEGSLSSSGKRKKAQESRLVRDEHANLSPQQRNWLLKVEEPVNC